jgi:hypothetical protein
LALGSTLVITRVVSAAASIFTLQNCPRILLKFQLLGSDHLFDTLKLLQRKIQFVIVLVSLIISLDSSHHDFSDLLLSFSNFPVDRSIRGSLCFFDLDPSKLLDTLDLFVGCIDSFCDFACYSN